MIKRYSNEIIDSIWTDQQRFEYYKIYCFKYLNFILEKEVKIPKFKMDINAIQKIEKDTKHEIVSVLKYLNKNIKDPKQKKYLHYKLTSSDIIDTVSSMQIKSSLIFIETLIESIIKKNYEWEGLVAGRTHGQYAEVISLQNRYDSFLNELYSCKKSINYARSQLKGKAHGPTGQYVWKRQEEFIKSFSLKMPVHCTQIIARHEYIDFMVALAKTASCIERFSTNFRLSALSGIDELSEKQSTFQCGSSAMPHKNNPILNENLCGLARLVRTNLAVSFENISLWHERDMTHSSTERIIWPDTFHLVAFMLTRLKYILDNMSVNVFKNLKVISYNEKKLTSHNKMIKDIDTSTKTRLESYENLRVEFRKDVD